MMETYHGYVRTPADAIKLFEACRLGLLPRVQRRLSEKERQSIRSGSVFVWDEREAGMRRWTDGKSWSASRVSGSFLTYREMEGKRGGGFGGNTTTRRLAGKTPDSSGRGSDEDQDETEPDGYRYKADGLMKQSFSITTSQGQHLHLISYYSRPQPGQPELIQPSNDTNLRHIVPVKGMYPESSMNDAPGPALTRAPMHQTSPYAGAHPPPPQQPAPPSAPPQYAPYGTTPGYSWPPSPISTPPYSHYQVASAYPQSQLPPPSAAPHYTPQQPPYAASPTQYDRAPLPPIGAGAGPPQRRTPPPALGPYGSHGPTNHLANSPHLSHSRVESPRSQHLPAPGPPSSAALGVRNPQGLLPGLSAGGPARTPPQRALSVSPPRSSHSDMNLNLAPSSNKASLSALLHPTPASSEPNSANPGNNSAGSSPRQMTVPPMMAGGPLPHLPPQSEDARTISVLDRKFRI